MNLALEARTAWWLIPSLKFIEFVASITPARVYSDRYATFMMSAAEKLIDRGITVGVKK